KTPLGDHSTNFLSGQHIMLIDYHEAQRGILKEALESHQAIVTTVDSINKVNISFNARPVDLIILSLQHSQIEEQYSRELSQYSVPVILLIPFGTYVADSKSYSAIMTKPIRLFGLMKIVKNLLLTSQPEQAIIRSGKISSSVQFEHSPLNILVVEDNPVNQTLALHILKKLGYNATLVENGLQALEAVDKVDYDIIFMDIQMPDLDGLAATQRIR